MTAKHPETELVPYLRGELNASERVQVERHLEQCLQCRKWAVSAAAILSQVAASVNDVRAPEWTNYRADLGRKLRAVANGRRVAQGTWWRTGFGWPSIAVTAAAAAVLTIALVAHRGAGVSAPGVDQLEMPPEMSGADVGLLANYRVVEHLDLLENYEVIEHLDDLAPGDSQNHETPS